MDGHLIEIYRVSGTHREVGLQLGDIGADQIAQEIKESFAELPAGRTREQQLALAAEYRHFTEPRLPWLIEEFDGVAEGAGVDPLEFFAASMEEIWYEPRAKQTQGKCSDLVAGPAATADGHLIVGHTNDLRPATEHLITAIEKTVPGEPVTFQLGGVPWLSVGWNSAGLSLTGNELSPNDEKIGISRSHQVLEMLRTGSLDEMVAAAVRPDRASSYNNVLASSDGRVVNVEGSATDQELTGLDGSGHLVHTNHYVCDRMIDFEGDPEYAKRSAVRYKRGRDLLKSQSPSSITVEGMRGMLADHAGRPDSICRHAEASASDSKTVFWSVADVTEGRILFGRGNPCEDTPAQEYAFAR
jgi:isopenicillin-N N-acyltransferase-like protein